IRVSASGSAMDLREMSKSRSHALILPVPLGVFPRFVPGNRLPTDPGVVPNFAVISISWVVFLRFLNDWLMNC
ncbi:MAG: hypothetical protein P8X63_11800, partial [Desulfuromonadaceae bacterium]